MEEPQIQPAISLQNFRVIRAEFSNDISRVLESGKKLNIDVKFNLGFNNADKKKYLVKFFTTIESEDQVLKIYTESIAYFESNQEIDDKLKKSHLLLINSPAIAFPLVRSFIITLTGNTGINPIYLPSFNFTGTKIEPKDTE